MKKRKATNPFSDRDGQLMVTAACRYCIGRRSYIVGACIAWLRQWWHEFDRITQTVIIRDIVESLQDLRAGDDCDAFDWKCFASWGFGQLDHRGKTWVRNSVAYRNKPWPLDDKRKTTRRKNV